MSDDKDLPERAGVQKPVARGFRCGDGPCRTFYVFENEAEQPPVKKLPDAPDQVE